MGGKLSHLSRVPSGRHGSTPIMNALDEELASRTPTPDGRVRLPPMPTHSPTSPLQPLAPLYSNGGGVGGVDRAAREARGELRAMGGAAWGGGSGGGGGECPYLPLSRWVVLNSGLKAHRVSQWSNLEGAN